MIPPRANRNRDQGIRKLTILSAPARRTARQPPHLRQTSGPPDTGDTGCNPTKAILFAPGGVVDGIVPKPPAGVSSDFRLATRARFRAKHCLVNDLVDRTRS